MERSVIINDLKNYYDNNTFINLTNYDYDSIPDNVLSDFFNKHCKEHKITVNVQDIHKLYNNAHFLVNTPDGFQEVGDLYIKGPYHIFMIKTADFSIKCSENHLLETTAGWVMAKDIKKNMPINTKNGYQTVTYVRQGKEQVTYDFEVMHENHRYWGGTGISSHNTGKSYLACSVVREAQKLGATCIYMDSEGAIDSTFVKRLGVDPSKLIIKQVSTIAETSRFIANTLDALQKQEEEYGKHQEIMFVLDSLGNLTSDKEMQDTKEGNNKRDMTKAQEIRALFRVNATALSRMQATMIVINHVYGAIGSYVPTNISSGGGGIRYNSSLTIELTVSKLEDKNNDKAASQKQGTDTATKMGVLVTAKPVKSRFCRPYKVKFQIPFFTKPNPYVGLEVFMNWENSGVVRGNIIDEKAYNKLSDAAKEKIYTFDYNGETMYCEPKDTARGIVVKHLGCQVPFTEFFSDKVFTQEFLEYLNENVIHPMFDLPSQDSFEDIKEIEDIIEVGTDA